MYLPASADSKLKAWQFPHEGCRWQQDLRLEVPGKSIHMLHAGSKPNCCLLTRAINGHLLAYVAPDCADPPFQPLTPACHVYSTPYGISRC